MRDALLIAFIVGAAILLLWIARRLAAAEDWVDRVGATHATLYSHLAEYAFWACRHLLAIRIRGERRRRFIAALAALTLFMVVVTPALFAGSAIHSTLVRGEADAIALGVIIWSAVVELPGLPARLGLHFGDDGIPVLAIVFVISALDAIVCGVALSNLLEGSFVKSMLTGVGLVAIGDLLSVLLGLATAAALPRPLSDPCPCLGLPAHDPPDEEGD